MANSQLGLPEGSCAGPGLGAEMGSEGGDFGGESTERNSGQVDPPQSDLNTPPLKKRLKDDFQFSSLHSVRLPSGNSGLKLLSCAIDSANSHFSKFTPGNFDCAARCSDFVMCKSPYASRLLTSITNTYLSPAPYPLLTFETPSKYPPSLYSH